ncbi:hypothetical protein BJV78DRAFT_1201580 [Lactifluus subvellereus]|nr:hypothetical protein BJV78DRAFT_1201580 [Lactifluus subvellereus]
MCVVRLLTSLRVLFFSFAHHYYQMFSYTRVMRLLLRVSLLYLCVMFHCSSSCRFILREHRALPQNITVSKNTSIVRSDRLHIGHAQLTYLHGIKP